MNENSGDKPDIEKPEEVTTNSDSSATPSSRGEINTDKASWPPQTTADQATVKPGTPASKKPSLPLGKLLWAVPAVAVIAAAVWGGYAWGKGSVKPVKTVASTTKTQDLSVPKGATMVSQCTTGVGMQYALPKDIPYGPLYNVYQGKVIGIEYMTQASADTSGSSMNGTKAMDSSPEDKTVSLPLYGKNYDHINVYLMPEGHAGLNVPHYMADVMMVPKSLTDKITCGNNSSNMNMPGMTNMSPSTSDKSSSGSSMSM